MVLRPRFGTINLGQTGWKPVLRGRTFRRNVPTWLRFMEAATVLRTRTGPMNVGRQAGSLSYGSTVHGDGAGVPRTGDWQGTGEKVLFHQFSCFGRAGLGSPALPFLLVQNLAEFASPPPANQRQALLREGNPASRPQITGSVGAKSSGFSLSQRVT